MLKFVAMALAAAALLPAAAHAQADEAKEPRRYRVALGAQLVPRFPGAEDHKVRPLWDISTARGDDAFEFEAPDESTGITLLRAGRLEAGPSFGFEGKRKRDAVAADIDEVGFTIEAGAFANLWLTDGFRIHAEGRKGLNGHRGWIGSAGVDYVARRGDDWLFSIGPRVGLSDGRYQRAYFGVSPRVAAATGLPAYSPDGGVHSAGVTAGALYQIDRRWGVTGYAKYDRLVGDAERSPFIRTYGSRDQLSGGLALTYTFGGD